MSTVHETADGRLLFCKGAPEVVIPRCEGLDTGEGIAALDGAHAELLRTALDAMADQGLRALALAMFALEEGRRRLGRAIRGFRVPASSSASGPPPSPAAPSEGARSPGAAARRGR